MSGATRLMVTESSGFSRLTDAQRRCVAYLLEGFSDREIAAELGLSVRTVKAYLADARGRLGGFDAGERWWVRAAYELGRAAARHRSTDRDPSPAAAP